MTEDELEERLKERGYEIGPSTLSDDGMMLRNINRTFMFRLDAVDLASGAATLDEIVNRNKGKVFPEVPKE